MKHLIRSEGVLNVTKSQERIDLLDNLLIKGTNKFNSEIEAIKRIPEDKRFIIKNIDCIQPLEDSDVLNDYCKSLCCNPMKCEKFWSLMFLRKFLLPNS